MDRYMCVRTCQVANKDKNGKTTSAHRVMAGAIVNAEEPPNEHFVKMVDESKTLIDILSEKLEKYDVDTTDMWDTDRMQRMLAEKEAESKEPALIAKIQRALDDMGVKYHRMTGLKKLRKMAMDNNIEVE